MRRSRRQNFASLPHALSNSSEKTHWNLSATMLRCSRSIWHSFGCFDSHIRNGSVGWMARKVQINQLVKSSYVWLRSRRPQQEGNDGDQIQPVDRGRKIEVRKERDGMTRDRDRLSLFIDGQEIEMEQTESGVLS